MVVALIFSVTFAPLSVAELLTERNGSKLFPVSYTFVFLTFKVAFAARKTTAFPDCEKLHRLMATKAALASVLT